MAHQRDNVSPNQKRLKYLSLHFGKWRNHITAGCVWDLIAVAQVCLIFQVKGCQGARDAANYRALLGERTEATEAARNVPALSFLLSPLEQPGLMVCLQGCLPEGHGLRVREGCCLLLLSIREAEAWLKRRDRQLSWAWLFLPLVHQARDGQSASGHATGLENWQEGPTWAWRYETAGVTCTARHVMSVDLTCHNSIWLLAGSALSVEAFYLRVDSYCTLGSETSPSLPFY